MNLNALVQRVTAWAQIELRTQTRLRDVLQAMEAAVRANETERLVELGVELEAALADGPARDRMRIDVMSQLAKAWGIAPGTMTLSSVIERAASAGVNVTVMTDVRDELRARIADVMCRARLLSVVASQHRGVLAELLAILGASSNDEEARRSGVLVNAEA